jgi:hypothetical protein
VDEEAVTDMVLGKVDIDSAVEMGLDSEGGTASEISNN